MYGVTDADEDGFDELGEFPLLKCLGPEEALFLLARHNTPRLELQEKALLELIRRLTTQEPLAEVVTGFVEGTGSHPADRADAAVLANQIAATLPPLQKRLRATQEALAKIKQGRYGVCETCNEIIDAAVLIVCPESRHCWRCKLAARKKGGEEP